MKDAKYLKVVAEFHYWEDAIVNGVEDVDGTLIPCRDGESWEPIIDLETGKIINWVAGVEADIHYKVCDAGKYWLLNAEKQEVAKWVDYYVPNDILCVGTDGYGDYIIFCVDKEGCIVGWKPPRLQKSKWRALH